MSTWIKPEHKDPVLSEIYAFTKGEIIYVMAQTEQHHKKMNAYWYYAIVQEFDPEQKVLLIVHLSEPSLTSARIIAREDWTNENHN